MKNIHLKQNFGVEEITYSLWAMVHGMASLQIGRLDNFDADFKTTDSIALQIFINGILE